MSKSSLLVLALGLFAMFWALNTARNSFERLPHLEDEYAYTYQAQIFARGDVVIPTPEPRRAFWQPFLIDAEGKRFGKYPPGWPLWLALGYVVGLPSVVNAWFALLNVVLIYRLGREIFDETTGVLAAILLTASPITILQNATLMPHTSALFFTTLCLYALWRMEKEVSLSRLWWWGALAGGALGMLITIRPSVAAAVAIPLMGYSGWRWLWSLLRYRLARVRTPEMPWWGRYLCLLGAILILAIGVYAALDWLTTWPHFILLLTGVGMAVAALRYVVIDENARQNPPLPHRWFAVLWPLVIMALMSLWVGSLYPAFNYMATGDPFDNLYTYIWPYDTFGMGDGHGRPLATSVSGPPGSKIALIEYHNWARARQNFAGDSLCYGRDLFGWVAQPDTPPHSLTDARYPAELCLANRAGYSWVALPLGIVVAWRRRWTYVLLGVAMAVIGFTAWYWIGATVYSARYFFEATSALVLLSAAGLAGLVQAGQRFKLHSVVYTLIGIMAVQSVWGFGPRRLDPLEAHFTDRARQQLTQAERWHTQPEHGLLVIVLGDVHWREVNGLMAKTSPYLDSPIILARDPDQTTWRDLMVMFPGYQVIYYKDGQFSPSPYG